MDSESTAQLPDGDVVPDYGALGRLDGRSIVIVGAGAGMGRQTAHAASAAGARVGCVDLTLDLAGRVAEEVGGVALVGDACDEAALADLLSQAESELGPISGIVDIIGGARFVNLVDSSADDWEHAQRLNLSHALTLARLGAPLMSRAGGGSLVYIASYDGISGSAYHAFYGMAKAALLSLINSAAVELGPLGVRVNGISPGIIWTPRMSSVIGKDYDRWAGLGPLGRTGLPRDVAGCALYLLCGLSDYVTGQNIVIDGGVGAVSPYPTGELVRTYPTGNLHKGA